MRLCARWIENPTTNTCAPPGMNLRHLEGRPSVRVNPVFAVVGYNSVLLLRWLTERLPVIFRVFIERVPP
jgi:hypothetical protein